MKIAIDLDGVVFESEKLLRIYSELYDMLELKQNSKIDNTETMFQARFAWTDEETNNFTKIYLRKVWNETQYVPGVKTVLNLLKKDGHELIVITARGGTFKEAIEITKNKLIEDGLDVFDKYFWAIDDKGEICEKEKIDLFIDDYYKNCIDAANRKIKTIYFKDAPSKELEENEYLKVLYNWGEVYRYIKENYV